MEQKPSKEGKETKNQNELNEILKKNEYFIAQQKITEEEIEKIKKENEDKKEQIKTKTNPELFELVINELKDYLASQEQTKEIAQEKQNLENEINNAYYKAKQAIQFTKDAELQNKDIIAKIKAINEQKNEIEKKLKQDYEETKAQCDKFKEEYKKKFDEVSNEALIKENEDLAKKVQETKENSANIKKNINEQLGLRKEHEDTLTNQYNSKLSEITKETDKMEEENEKLRKEIEKEKDKFGGEDFTQTIKKKFEKVKKEYEKVYKDYIQLKKENEKLREVDPVSIKEEIENNKRILDELVKNNKELQAKIKEFKEKKNNPPPVEENKIEDKKEENNVDDKKEENKIENNLVEEKKETEENKGEETKVEDKKIEEKKIEDKKVEDKKDEKEKENKKDKMQEKSELIL